MSLANDIVKILYISQGYLPNYPYHLISDVEMMEAFMNNDTYCYFNDMYPCQYNSLQSYYDELKTYISEFVDNYISNNGKLTIPDWIYSYMLGEVIGPYSNLQDKHDLLVLMNLDNINDILTEQSEAYCYKVSVDWIRKLPTNQKRPPTIFGEPHVIKSLRLLNLELNAG